MNGNGKSRSVGRLRLNANEWIIITPNYGKGVCRTFLVLIPIYWLEILQNLGMIHMFHLSFFFSLLLLRRLRFHLSLSHLTTTWETWNRRAKNDVSSYPFHATSVSFTLSHDAIHLPPPMISSDHRRDIFVLLRPSIPAPIEHTNAISYQRSEIVHALKTNRL